MDQTTNSAILALIIISIVAIFFIVVLLIYIIFVVRKSNIVMKKFDYLIEDITYKAESLNVTVDTINKFSNYLLTFDKKSQKSLKRLFILASENRDYIYSFFDKVKEDILTKDGEKFKTAGKKAKDISKKAKDKSKEFAEKAVQKSSEKVIEKSNANKKSSKKASEEFKK